MCDQFQLQRNVPAEISRCPSCGNCKRDSTLGSFPVKNYGMKPNFVPTYCIIRDPQCDMYWVDGVGVQRNQNGADGNDPKSAFVTPKQTPAQAPAATAPKANNNNNNSNNNNNNNKNTNKTNTANNNTAANNKGTSTSNTNNKGVANTNTNNKGVSNTPVSTGKKNNNSDTNLNKNKTGNAGNANDANNDAGETIQASDVMDNAGEDNNNGDVLTYVDSEKISSKTSNPNGTNLVDNNKSGLPGNNNNNNNSVSPLLIGCLSAFSILLIVVGFLYVRKRKRDEDEVDLVYSNSVFCATPIVQRDGPGSKIGSIHSNHSNRLNNSFNNGYNVANQTAISSGNDGDFDIVIQPTNVVTDNHPALDTQRNVGPINAYAETSAYANTEEGGYDPNTSSSSLLNNSRSINVSATENFISESHINAATSGMSQSILSPTSAAETSNVIVSAGDVSEDVISPTVPNGTYQYPNQQQVPQQDIMVQNVSMSYDMNDVSVQEPSISFINNSNGISFSNKDESCVLSPIMDKSQSNIFTADMVNENSVSDIKQISSTPKLNTSVGKKTLSMVISEYKEDTLYAAKFNYEPSMEDEMRIRINDRVLVKEIFNDGWAYGENKTSESFGIFPINRLDSSS